MFEGSIPQGQFQSPQSTQEDELVGLAAQADVLVTRGRPIDDGLMAAAEQAKLVHVMGRYPDMVDVAAARTRKIPVATMPHGGAIAVAEHTIALMLALSRQLLPSHRGVVTGEYRERGLTPEPTDEWNFAFNWLGSSRLGELRGKTLGLVGFGEIAKEVARRARAFDMQILYTKRNPLRPEWEARLGVQSVSLDELLAQSDYVSLHAPHSPETERLLHADRLASMKKTAVVINTSRGGLIEETALCEALMHGQIAGAGLDVFQKEPLPADHPLAEMHNVILTPHTGGGTGGGQKGNLFQVLENIARFERGETPHHTVVSFE